MGLGRGVQSLLLYVLRTVSDLFGLCRSGNAGLVNVRILGFGVKSPARVTRDNIKAQRIGSCCAVPRGTVLTIARSPVLCCNLF